MFDTRTVFTLAVSFLTDFMAAFMAALTGGGAATGEAIPSKFTVFVAIGSGLVIGLRGLQKNLSPAVGAAPPANG